MQPIVINRAGVLPIQGLQSAFFVSMPTVLPLSSLNWSFRQVSPSSRWRPARVPGCVHQDLRRNGLISDPFHGTHELDLQWIEEEEWEYRASFRVNKAFLAEDQIELVAEGLDTVAEVRLNGRRIARTENMFSAFRWEVGRHLKAGVNELQVRFGSAMKYVRTHRTEHNPVKEFNDPVGGCTRIRKQGCQFGWDWGPRLVTAGIWRDIRLEAWSGVRLAGVQIRQQHQPRGVVVLEVSPELEGKAGKARLQVRVGVSHEGREVASAVSAGGACLVRIPEPKLWWPAGQGAQPLYTVSVELRDFDSGERVDSQTRRIGLRSIQLECKPDQWGESFRFVVNGRPVFAKGANWIPVHAFVAGLGRAEYERDLRAAVAANMNMLRVWGGGIYENEAFYELCDELGLMVWQDFMFACTLYPGDDSFAALVEQELRTQIPRLRHHACLALWCGNNEIASINIEELKAPATRRAYERLFHELIPEQLSQLDPDTPYWPSSEWHGEFGRTTRDGESRGDTHFWEVWHSRKPVSEYERYALRFCSEFGMQSYCSPETQAEFCPADDRNLFGRTMENHQKNTQGNQIILDYVTRRYGMPRDQESLMVLSQLNQAHCMQVAVEHYRRLAPRCMGALYWQLNDNWPVASWSSIEHNGRWKALHHAARRFFAPSLVSAEVPGDETQGKGNYRSSTVRWVHLHTVHDAPVAARGTVVWQLMLSSGRVLRSGRKAVVLRPGESRRQLSIDSAPEQKAHGRDRLVLRIALEIGRRVVSEEGVLLTQPRFAELPEPSLQLKARRLGVRRYELTVKSPVYQHRFSLALKPAHRLSDNHFDLWPGRARTLLLELDRDLSPAALRRALRWQSYASLRA
jgi:beta-mannosidase